MRKLDLLVSVVTFFIALAGASATESKLNELILSLNKQKPVHSGPNCFNLSLVSSGLAQHLVYTSEAEFEFFVKSPLCRELSTGSERQTGDIGIIWFRMGSAPLRPFHAFVILQGNSIFHKPGQGKTKPYSLSTIEKTDSDYAKIIADDCERSHLDARDCGSEIKFYHCGGEDMLKDKIKAAPSEVRAVLADISKFEESLQKKLLLGVPLGAEAKSYFVETMKNVAEVLSRPEIILQSQAMSKEDKEIVFGLLLLRINALVEQLSHIIDIADPDGYEGIGISVAQGGLNYLFNDLMIVNAETGFSGRVFRPYLSDGVISGADMLKVFSKLPSGK